MRINFKIEIGKYFAPVWMGTIFISLLFWVSPQRLPSEQQGSVAHPSRFKVKVSLPKVNSSRPGSGLFGAGGFGTAAGLTADIAVNILDARFYPVKTFVLRAVKSQERIESLWDGRDIYGKETPPGNYYASLSIVYSDGTKEPKFFKFVKE